MLTNPHTLDLIILLTLFALTVWMQLRQLPLQNVVTVILLIIVLATLVTTSGAKWGIPFGRFIFSENLGERWFDLAPWPVPLLWVIALLNGRGVARLILRPWRKLTNYGLWVMALACILATFLDLVLEPYASQLRHYWIWQRIPGANSWYNTPWINFFGWLAAALFIFIIITPWLINKRAGKNPPDYLALIIWGGLMIVLSVGAGLQQYWLAAGIGGLIAVATATVAWKNSRW